MKYGSIQFIEASIQPLQFKSRLTESQIDYLNSKLKSIAQNKIQIIPLQKNFIHLHEVQTHEITIHTRASRNCQQN